MHVFPHHETSAVGARWSVEVGYFELIIEPGTFINPTPSSDSTLLRASLRCNSAGSVLVVSLRKIMQPATRQVVLQNRILFRHHRPGGVIPLHGPCIGCAAQRVWFLSRPGLYSSHEFCIIVRRSHRFSLSNRPSIKVYHQSEQGTNDTAGLIDLAGYWFKGQALT